MRKRPCLKVIILVLSTVFCGLYSIAYAQAQNYQQEPVMSYPSYERESPQNTPPAGYQQPIQQNYQQVPQNYYQQTPAQNFQQAPQQNYQPAQPHYNQQPHYQNGHPSYSYSGMPTASPQTFTQKPVQVYKRAPRMPYQDTGHTNYSNPMFEPAANRAYPVHYQTSNNINYQRQINPRLNMRRNILRAFFGESPQRPGGGASGGFGGNNNPALAGQASSQKSIALSEADSAEACADRATYGSPGSRRSAAYEARSHANRARSAAEEAQSLADQGSGEAKDYAADAWNAYYRARSAADRAEDSANENVQ